MSLPVATNGGGGAALRIWLHCSLSGQQWQPGTQAGLRPQCAQRAGPGPPLAGTVTVNGTVAGPVALAVALRPSAGT